MLWIVLVVVPETVISTIMHQSDLISKELKNSLFIILNPFDKPFANLRNLIDLELKLQAAMDEAYKQHKMITVLAMNESVIEEDWAGVLDLE